MIDQLPPEFWPSLITAGLTLLVSAAHRRGRRLPILEMVLDWILIQPKAKAEDPAADRLLDELRKRLPLPGEP